MGWVTSNDLARIHFVEWGDPRGEPILFVHGLGTDNIGWAMQRRAFGSDYRCIAVDNRGSGRSDKPEGPYDLEQLAFDAISVLDKLGIDSAHVIGASMGGALAQIIAVRHPDRVRSLTLACTACSLRRWREELFDGWIQLIQEKGMREFAVHNLEWIFGPRSFRRLYPVAVALGPFLLRAPEHGFLGQVQALRDVDPEIAELLSTVTAPTLVITGSQDILTPVSDAEEIADRIAHSELVIIRGAAHGFMVEQAGLFNRVVKDFIDRQSLSASAERRRGSIDDVIGGGSKRTGAGSVG